MLRKLAEEFGDHPLDSITTRQIERYLTRRRNIDGITTATTNRYLATLKTLFKTPATGMTTYPTIPLHGSPCLKNRAVFQTP